MNYQILVLDLDGTLTNSEKKITPPTLEALIRIQENGKKVVLASGRPTYGVEPLARELHLERYGSYILSFNGARITDCRSGQIIYNKALPADSIQPIYEIASHYPVDILAYGSDKLISGLNLNKYTELESRINGIPIRDVENFVGYVNFPVNKCLFTAPMERAAGLERRLAAQFVGRLSVYRSEPFFIEVMPLHVDKAASLERLLNRLGMCARDVIACGDGFNDLSMIRFAGVGVAMANAQESVKREADYVTLSNDEDGVAHVIEKYILET